MVGGLGKRSDGIGLGCMARRCVIVSPDESARPFDFGTRTEDGRCPTDIIVIHEGLDISYDKFRLGDDW